MKITCLILNIFSLLYINLLNAQPSKARSDSPFDFRIDTVKSRYIKFQEDTIATNVNKHYDKILDSTFNLDKNYDFEFRLWKRHLSNNFDNVFIMTFKNNKWIARYFDREDGNRFTERKTDQEKVNHLWISLVNHDILTLPSQRAIQDKLINYVVDTNNILYGTIRKTDLTDGISYGFELLTPGKKRYYNYACPHAFLKMYGNVKELYQVVVIIMLIQKFLGQGLLVC